MAGRKATVKSLVVHGIGKKLHRSGEVVTEESFQPAGKFDQLIKEGHLIEVTEGAAVPTFESAKAAAKTNIGKGAATIAAEERAAAIEKAKGMFVEMTDTMSTADILSLIAQKEQQDAEIAAENAAAAEARANALSAATEAGVETTDEMSTEDILSAIESKKSEARNNAVSAVIEAGIEVSDEMSVEQILDAIATKEKEKAAEEKANADKAEFEAAKIAADEYKGGKTFVNAKGETKTVNAQADITVKELVKELEDAKLEFNHIAPKVVLFAKWIAL